MLRACVSLTLRERSNPGLLRKFRRRLPQAATGSARGIEQKIDEIGLLLPTYPHYRLKGSNRYRARIGDYRIIYTFDLRQNKIHLLAIGHRREIYRNI